MHRSVAFLVCLVLASFAWAEPFDPYRPESALVMGRGGSFTATASGYNSFFYNPAGFARRGEFTLASTNLWVFMDRDLVELARGAAGPILGLGASSGSVVAPRSLDPAALEALGAYFDDLAGWVETTDPATIEQILIDATGDTGLTFTGEDDLAALLAAAGTDDIIAFLEDLEAAAIANGAALPFTVAELKAALAAALPRGYLRVGGQVGLGYLGNGIGLGLFANGEMTVDGTDIFQAYGTAYNTITFVGGLGLTFGRLDVGLAIRPTVFGYTRVKAAPVIATYLSGGTVDLATMFSNTVYFGSGLGLDIGARIGFGPLAVGLAIRDLFGTRIDYRSTTFAEYSSALSSASLPLGSPLSDAELDAAWRIPMKVNLGLEFHPDLGVVRYLFDPSISIDLLDVTAGVRVVQEGGELTPDVLLSMLNFGAQADLLRVFSVRAGYYGGYLSAGVGLKVFLIDINAAVAGDFRRDATGTWGFTDVGGAIEAAIRF